MKRRVITASLFLLSTTAFLLAGRQGTIITHEGQALTGEVTETRESVTVVRKGVTSIFPRVDVAEIDYSSFIERFEKALSQLASDDVDGRITLAREAFDQREYALAQKAIDQAVDINPLNRSAMELSRAISNQMTLENASQRQPATRIATTRDEGLTANNRRQTRGLSHDQVNIVRQQELQPGEQVRIQFRNNARKAFVDSQPGLSFRDFNTLTDSAQALQILEKGSDELRRDVIIMNDPQSIRTFGRRLHTAIVQGCATSQCHGGNAAGDFKLLTGTRDASTLVTNFYLVNHYVRSNTDLSGSLFAPTKLHMVDRGHATDSLLYQYALPRAKARLKHPEVRNWDGIMVNETDRIADDLRTWMDRDLAPVTPDYGFSFSLLPATQPTTAPSDDLEPSDATPESATAEDGETREPAAADDVEALGVSPADGELKTEDPAIGEPGFREPGIAPATEPVNPE